MKKLLLIAIASTLSICVQAQSAGTEDKGGERIWTTEFKSVDINAPVKLIFNQIDDDDAPYVTYDNHGSGSAFTAGTDKNGVLKIREKSDGKRTSITEVEVGYHRLEDIRISRADVLFRDTLNRAIADITVSDGAHLRATVDIKDLKICIANKCVVELSGSVRYLTADVSSSILDASALRCMSCRIGASHKSEVDIDVDERVEAEASYGAEIRYSKSPSIVRSNISVFGGKIIDKSIDTGNISTDTGYE